jgi:hypothetical protein
VTEKGCSISEDLPALSMLETPPLLLLLLGMFPVVAQGDRDRAAAERAGL